MSENGNPHKSINERRITSLVSKTGFAGIGRSKQGTTIVDNLVVTNKLTLKKMEW